MRLPRWTLSSVTGLLAAAAVALPAVAVSETTTIEAITGCSSSYPSYPCWGPSTVTIASGGSVKFVNKSSALEQGVRWVGAAPSCENVPTSNQKGPWEGSCAFAQPGNYRFEGTQIYSSAGEVIVTGTVATTPTGVTTTTPSPSDSSSTSTTPSPQPGLTTGGPSTDLAASPLVGSASSAVKLPAVQRGKAVHGSLDISTAGVGGRLEVELLSTRASLASAASASQVPVGRVVRSSLQAGAATFTAQLDARARHALHARGRLAITVKIVLVPVTGSSLTLTRGVLLRA